MLHRVNNFEKNRLYSNENMKVSPEFLEELILDLKSQNYEFISLEEVYEVLNSGKHVKKKIVMTLDDGYKDNYTIAYPIFKKYNIPFTVYITTSFPEKNALLWWYILEDLILQEDVIELSDRQIFECKTKEQKEETFLKIRDIILTFEKKTFLESLKKLLIKYSINWYLKNDELCMNWDEIIELSKDDLCTIAGHTKNHFSFNQLSENEIIDEITDANKMIENKIGKKIEHFAYPFGSKHEVNKREFDIVKKFGFKTMTTTRNGNIYKEHKKFLECLPRLMLKENFNIKNIGRIRRKKVVTI